MSVDHQTGLDRRSLLLAGAGVATFATAAPRSQHAAAGTKRPPRKVRHTFRGHFDQFAPDWHYLPFEVTETVTEIQVSYDYESTNTGAGFSLNVIDIGLFDGSGHGLGRTAGFRGWSGGARKSFRVNRRYATPGYLAGPLTPGTWHVILGPVGIVPPGVDWKVTITLVHGKPAKRRRPKPPPRRVKGAGAGWYRGDLHLHTVHSDGKRSPKLMAQHVREAGLDFMVSTDHNTTSSHSRWRKPAGKDLLVILGEEITTRGGHWIAAGLPAGPGSTGAIGPRTVS
ncbi:CehA/McbA family metallohydrolase [Nocardioides sp.]|uniref:CehA/McbA family metallohydrolase n=1 Tax=Nocardioides sp. TaxID=35761 RepID=UPI00356835AC